jgi:hypothetical protein
MHSPWGAIYPIMKETGWSKHYILWRISWINVQLIMADAPGIRSKTKADKKKVTGKQAAEMFN